MLTTQSTKIFFGQGAFKPYSSIQKQGTDNYSIITQNKVDIDKTNHSSFAKIQSSSNEVKYDVDNSSAELKIDHENIVLGRWSHEEHKLFLEAMEKYGNSWLQVKNCVKTRTFSQIRSHAQKYYEGLRKRAIRKCKENNAKRPIFAVVREYLNVTTALNSLYKLRKKLNPK